MGVVRNPYWNISSQVLQRQLPQLNSALEALKGIKAVTLIDPVEPKVGLFDKVSPDSGKSTILNTSFNLCTLNSVLWTKRLL